MENTNELCGFKVTIADSLKVAWEKKGGVRGHKRRKASKGGREEGEGTKLTMTRG